MICILHQNESGGQYGASKKMRGHLGSEGTRKAYSIISISLGTGQFNVDRLKSRGKPWDSFAFRIENESDGITMPRMLGEDEILPSPAQVGINIKNILMEDYDYAYEVFTKILETAGEVGKTDFCAELRSWIKDQVNDKGVKATISKDNTTEIYTHWKDNGGMFTKDYGKTILINQNEAEIPKIEVKDLPEDELPF